MQSIDYCRACLYQTNPIKYGTYNIDYIQILLKFEFQQNYLDKFHCETIPALIILTQGKASNHLGFTDKKDR